MSGRTCWPASARPALIRRIPFKAASNVTLSPTARLEPSPASRCSPLRCSHCRVTCRTKLLLSRRPRSDPFLAMAVRDRVNWLPRSNPQDAYHAHLTERRWPHHCQTHSPRKTRLPPPAKRLCICSDPSPRTTLEPANPPSNPPSRDQPPIKRRCSIMCMRKSANSTVPRKDARSALPVIRALAGIR